MFWCCSLENNLKTHSLYDMPKDNMNKNKNNKKASKSHIMVNSVYTIRFLNE